MLRPVLRCLLASFFLLSTVSSAVAQDTIGLGDGSDGAFDLMAGSSSVNTYAAVTAAVSPGDTEVDVGSVAGLAVGDAALLWQTQTSSSVTLGAQSTIALDDGTVGNYDLIRIAGIAGNTVSFETPIQGTYGATGAQLVRVPEYTTFRVRDGATVTGTAWDGSKGGVIAFVATGSVTVDGTIDANVLGFRGGNRSVDRCGINADCTCGNDVNLAASAVDSNCWTGRIGEGLSSANAYGVCGVGNNTTGGGGGGHINGGGAGGGNGGVGSRGGDAWCSGSDTGGWGGQKVSGSLTDYLTLGGGGGGGQMNNTAAGNGGRGGGVVVIRRDSENAHPVVLRTACR